MSKNGLLIIVRHSESEWNAKGVWTGWTDVSLSAKGKDDAVEMGKLLRDIHFDTAYTSTLKRTHQTLDGVLKGKADQTQLPRIADKALDERDYGDLTGKNKWEVQQEVGESAFQHIRRSWDYPVPGGETLKDVHARLLPYFTKEILPRLQTGEHILVVSHGNTLRALMKELDDIPAEKMGEVEMPFDTTYLYEFESNNPKPVSKSARKADLAPSMKA